MTQSGPGIAAIGLAAGLAAAWPVLRMGRARPAGAERRLYVWVLAATHFPYLAFALVWQSAALEFEAALLAPFLALAWLGRALHGMLLGAGLVAHSLIDILHPFGDGPAYAPLWYRWACISFDWLLGLYCLRRSATVWAHTVDSPKPGA